MPERVQDDLNHRVSARTCVDQRSVHGVRIGAYLWMHTRMRVRPALAPAVRSRDQAFCILSIC
jgi:hypothetical protein